MASRVKEVTTASKLRPAVTAVRLPTAPLRPQVRTVEEERPARPNRERKTPVQLSRAGKKAVSYYLDPETFMQLKMLSVQTGKSLQLLNEEAVQLLLGHYMETLPAS